MASVPQQPCFWCVLRFWSLVKIMLQCSQTNFFLWCTSSMCLFRLAEEPNTFPQIPQLKPSPVWSLSCMVFPGRVWNVFSQKLQPHTLVWPVEWDRESFLCSTDSLQDHNRWLEQRLYFWVNSISKISVCKYTYIAEAACSDSSCTRIYKSLYLCLEESTTGQTRTCHLTIYFFGRQYSIDISMNDSSSMCPCNIIWILNGIKPVQYSLL